MNTCHRRVARASAALRYQAAAVSCAADLVQAWRRWLGGLLLLLSALLLAACGGGSRNNDDDLVAPSITTQPASANTSVGATATFSVAAGGSGPLRYQWRRDGAVIVGATGASYTTDALVEADNGAKFSVVVSNDAGTVTSEVATLTVGAAIAPAITTQPAAVSIVAPATATFSVVATGSAPLTYQWRRDGTEIAGATGASYTTAATTPADNGAVFSVVVGNAGGSATSDGALLAVTAAPVAPAIATQPANATVNAGQNATFSVGANGTAPIAYQWRRNGSNITGATGASYTTPATQASDSGAKFSVVVSNGAGNVTSAEATLTVTTAPIAPAITAQPASASVTAGMTATFSVSASGTAPLNYQWHKNGTAIAGATSASYTTPATQASDSGALFSVVVANTAGSVTSNAATLTVGAAPVAPAITQQPADARVTAGSSATFSVTATGTAPLAYQWRRNGVVVAGATAASYTTPPTALADSGATFSVRISNGGGAVTSSNATLTVDPIVVAPTIATHPANASVVVGQSATFSVAANGTTPFTYQWRRDGVNVVGATTASYTTPATVTADNGAVFSVVVGNSAGSATSNGATLTVTQSWTGIREDGAAGFSDDSARAVATDPDGNVLIAGTVSEQFPSFDPAGLNSRAFVAKYSRSGVLQWAHKFPVPGNVGVPDEANGVASDAGGNVYVAGVVQGEFAGQTHAGGTRDIAVLKYSPAGNLLWARQFGSDGEDHGRALAVDAAGNVFIVGEAGQLPLQPPLQGELFIAKYDTNGNRLWIRQWGSGGDGANRDSGRGVAVDAAGNAYMAGYIPFNYAGTTPGGSGDGFVAKYDTNGNQVWFSRIRGLGPDEANAIAVAADGNTIYVTGRTNSDFDQPGFPPADVAPDICCYAPDAFVARLDGSGALQWVHNLSSLTQAGPSHYLDIGTSIATDANGSALFITGYTQGVMPGDASRGAQDIFVARYASSGARTWVRQFGADIPASGTRDDAGYGITLDGAGDLFVVGEAHGTFGTPNPSTDRTDWFVMKLRASDGTAY
jgi:hypothetical protein